VLYEGINKGDKDFSASSPRSKRRARISSIGAGWHTEGGLLVRQMRDQGVATVIMSATASRRRISRPSAGRASKGTLMTYGPDPPQAGGGQGIGGEVPRQNFEPESYTLYS